LIRGGAAGSPLWVRIREDPPHGGGLRDEGDDAPVGTAVQADPLAKDSNRRASSMAHG
jgi:hypothetical protein